MTYLELGELIEDFLSDSNELGPWGWDDFTSIKGKDTNTERVRQKVVAIADKHPYKSNWNKSEQEMWCSMEGMRDLSKLAKQLRSGGFDEKGTEGD